MLEEAEGTSPTEEVQAAKPTASPAAPTPDNRKDPDMHITHPTPIALDHDPETLNVYAHAYQLATDPRLARLAADMVTDVEALSSHTRIPPAAQRFDGHPTAALFAAALEAAPPTEDVAPLIALAAPGYAVLLAALRLQYGLARGDEYHLGWLAGYRAAKAWW